MLTWISTLERRERVVPTLSEAVTDPEQLEWSPKKQKLAATLAVEMRRLGVTGDSPQWHRLAELLNEMERLDRDYANEAGNATSDVEGLEAFIAADVYSEQLLGLLRTEFAPYFDAIARRAKRRRRVAKLVGWLIVAVGVTAYAAMLGGALWLIGHPGTRMIGDDIGRAAGPIQGLLLFLFVVGLFILPAFAIGIPFERFYKWAYREITGSDYGGKDAFAV